MTINSNQIRAARALINWSIHDLGKQVGVVGTTISAVETGRSKGSVELFGRIEAAFLTAGVEFTSDGGVRPIRNKIQQFEGREGFAAFRLDVLSTAQRGPTKISVSNVDERQFDKWGEGEVNEHYVSEMKKVEEINFRILVKEKDQYLTGSAYASYRWLPEDIFGEISFYIYGDKTALISFADSQFVAFVFSNPAITRFYQTEFERLWNKAKE